jgi:hypothetical protein
MCLAKVTSCTNCQQSFCSEMNICSEAKEIGDIHIPKQISTDCLEIDVEHLRADTYCIKIYTVMEQEHLQISRCNHCDYNQSFDLKPYPSCTENCCTVTVTQCSDCESIFWYGPQTLCPAADIGLIHITKDKYETAQDGKLSVSVHENQEMEKWALMYPVMKNNKVPGGACWGCRHG